MKGRTKRTRTPRMLFEDANGLPIPRDTAAGGGKLFELREAARRFRCDESTLRTLWESMMRNRTDTSMEVINLPANVGACVRAALRVHEMAGELRGILADADVSNTSASEPMREFERLAEALWDTGLEKLWPEKGVKDGR